ncbi:neprilysin-4 [Teleopsis dalmanni]|uniref:neprilysin-4 n=1 Tax=Teleopsis dalmanni TaxID=139649 RepID=UPI0018CCE08E|nr:neprilysin-4 [Teleopsis dalmanni]
MNVCTRLLLVAIVALLNCALSLQNPVSQNYSTSILRIAKSAQIKAYLDEDQDPCDDFYEFACGKWQRLHPARADLTKTFYLAQLDDLYIRKSADMLKMERKADTNMDILLKNFYSSCESRETLAHLGMTPILKIVELKGGWPKVKSASWYEDEYDWMKIVAEIRRKLGVDVLIGLDIVPDVEVNDVQRIKVGAPKLHLRTRKAYLEKQYEKQREVYENEISNKLHRYFPDMSSEWANEVAKQVVELEQELAKGLPKLENFTFEQTKRSRYASDLRTAYGTYVDLSRYLHLIFNETIYSEVYEWPEDYMTNLMEVIKNTPKLTIANYTMWRVINRFDHVADINKEKQDNWCVRKIIKYFPHQLERMFQHNYNSMQMVNELQSVWADIKNTFREELHTAKKLNWISLDTRQKAVVKLDSMDLEFITHNDENLEGQMYGLKFTRDNYYENLINIMQWKTLHKLAKYLLKPENIEKDTNRIKYQLRKNKIEVPITYLQSRFFWDPVYPTALKYGTLGFVLAQEMLQGFDSVGRKYDNHGFQRNWWDMNSEASFDDHTQCFKNQYENYKIKGKLSEDADVVATSVADNGAISIAHTAFRKWWSNAPDIEHSTNEILPSLKYNSEQLFFIGFGQLLCANYHESVTVYTEVPENVRVLGALSNQLAFVDGFKCDYNVNMNPKKKCLIW